MLALLLMRADGKRWNPPIHPPTYMQQRQRMGAPFSTRMCERLFPPQRHLIRLNFSRHFISSSCYVFISLRLSLFSLSFYILLHPLKPLTTQHHFLVSMQVWCQAICEKFYLIPCFSSSNPDHFSVAVTTVITVALDIVTWCHLYQYVCP